MFDFVASANPADQVRLARIERKLDLILAHLGLADEAADDDEADGSGLSQDVRDAADRGNKIEAIKRHREATGLGLAASKAAVEAYLSGRG